MRPGLPYIKSLFYRIWGDLLFIIAIDGPSASGKSVVGHLVAKELDWKHFSTGLVYRAYAHCLNLVDASLVNHLPQTLSDGQKKTLREAAVAFVDTISFKDRRVFFHSSLKEGKDEPKIKDITDILSTSEVSWCASQVAKHPFIRQLLLNLQRKIILQMPTEGVVVDGRDAGTVIFPDAALKIFLTASAEERARRRFQDAQRLGESIVYETVLQEMQARDQQDTSRVVAPLQAAAGSVFIDSTELSLQQVVDQIVHLALEKNDNFIKRIL